MPPRWEAAALRFYDAEESASHSQGTARMGTYRTTSEATLTDDDIERLDQTAERGEYPGAPGDLITITPVVAERTQYAHMPQHRSQLDDDPNENLDHTPSKR